MIPAATIHKQEAQHVDRARADSIGRRRSVIDGVVGHARACRGGGLRRRDRAPRWRTERLADRRADFCASLGVMNTAGFPAK